MAEEKKVVLHDTTDNDKHHAFAADHAERLLAYPGTVWRKPAAEQRPTATIAASEEAPTKSKATK